MSATFYEMTSLVLRYIDEDWELRRDVARERLHDLQEVFDRGAARCNKVLELKNIIKRAQSREGGEEKG
jgi:hypothetical protein